MSLPVDDRVFCVVCQKPKRRRPGESRDSWLERKTCSEPCYRQIMRNYQVLSVAKRRGGPSNTWRQFRHWDCKNYMICLTREAEANSPRWDCPKECEGKK